MSPPQLRKVGSPSQGNVQRSEKRLTKDNNVNTATAKLPRYLLSRDTRLMDLAVFQGQRRRREGTQMQGRERLGGESG